MCFDLSLDDLCVPAEYRLITEIAATSPCQSLYVLIILGISMQYMLLEVFGDCNICIFFSLSFLDYLESN